MGSLAPEHYKMTKKELEEFIYEIDTYLNPNNVIRFKDALNEYMDKGNVIIGKIQLCKAALKENSSKFKVWEEREELVKNRVSEVRKKIDETILCQ